MFVVTTRRAPVNTIGFSFDDQVFAKGKLLPIFNESRTPFFVGVEIICGVDEKHFVA